MKPTLNIPFRSSRGKIKGKSACPVALKASLSRYCENTIINTHSLQDSEKNEAISGQLSDCRLQVLVDPAGGFQTDLIIAAVFQPAIDIRIVQSEVLTDPVS